MRSTAAERLAAFEAAKQEIERMIDELVGNWAEIGFSDDEIHRVSDAAIEAALNVKSVENNK